MKYLASQLLQSQGTTEKGENLGGCKSRDCKSVFNEVDSSIKIEFSLYLQYTDGSISEKTFFKCSTDCEEGEYRGKLIVNNKNAGRPNVSFIFKKKVQSCFS